MRCIIMTRCFVVLIFIFGLSVNSFAELFMNFQPYESLSEIKAKYPNATFTKINPAWAKENDIMFSLTGEGLGGKIVLQLFDDREFFQELCEPPDVKQKDICVNRFNDPENMYILSMVRWIPFSKISIEKLTSKYGKPKFKTDEQFNNYAFWQNKKIFALLNDTKTIVSHIDYYFTDEEIEKSLELK